MTKSFGDLPYKQRGKHLGDDAEKVFEQVEDGWVRFGLHRPDLDVSQLPLKLRHAPDYLQEHRFADVVAFGRDRKVKVTVEKLMALCLWADEFPTVLWLYDWSEKAFGVVDVRDYMYVVCRSGKGDRFESDGRMYWSVDVVDIEPIVWQAAATPQAE